MTFNDALDYIHLFHQTGKKNGFVNINRLLELLGDPQKSLKFVHVAGTNGKGSTVSMIASSLQKAGYETGMFISPFIIEFRERIQINGEFVSKDDLISAVSDVKPIVEQMKSEDLFPSEFEIVTAISLLIFKKNNCDIVVFEVGLGGKEDVTNVIDTPLLSVITSISFDHMEILGNTIEEIASHKCGIIKPHGTTVCYPLQNENALAVIMEASAKKQNTLVMGNMNSMEVLTESLCGTDVIYKSLAIHIPLLGKHQIANCITAVEALLQLRLQGYNISDNAIIDGISAVRFPARMEIMHQKPLVIIDGAHNEDGMDALISSLELIKNRRIFLIIGMLKDKDFLHTAKKIARLAYRIITVTPPIYRGLSAAEMATALSDMDSITTAVDDLQTAYAIALKRAEENDVILICGSLYLAGDMRNIVK